MLLELFGIEKLSRKDSLFLVLVRIEGSDTLLCRTELLVGKSLFLKTVKRSVPRHQK